MVNKRELAKRVAQKTLLSQKEALQVVEELFSSILESLEEDEEVSIVGFGKFYLYTHSSRPVRNPKTQEEMMLEPYKSVKFKSSDKVKKHFKKKS
jgi:nucleoid DNA-binding protein|tara:strand:+ start:2440 stop:2724 length:285 start_codon:yes stop_codon:yes gene_type:complete